MSTRGMDHFRSGYGHVARCAIGGLVALLLHVAACLAHEIRPSYLELREDRPGEFDVLFKTPMRGEMRLSLAPAFPDGVEQITPPTLRITADAAIHTWRVRTSDQLHGRTIRIAGLENTLTDAIVRIVFADGTTWTQRLTPQNAIATVPPRQSAWSVAGIYLKLGVEHILTGIDHLLFVLALLLICRGTWLLVRTVTAFTVAHSVTLALASLGYVHVPSAPVEALIALSIVFVASEIVLMRQGREGLTARRPWLVAFVFGLLHGLGFAGALSEVGLPEGHIPLALLFFNIGVEIGQLAFVAAALSLIVGLQRMRIALLRPAELVVSYGIGSIAMFWVFDRVSGF
jgi:hypothetical protein